MHPCQEKETAGTTDGNQSFHGFSHLKVRSEWRNQFLFNVELAKKSRMRVRQYNRALGSDVWSLPAHLFGPQRWFCPDNSKKQQPDVIIVEFTTQTKTDEYITYQGFENGP